MPALAEQQNPPNYDPASEFEHLDKLHGSVEHVSYHNEDTGWCILKVKTRERKEAAIVTGKLLTVNIGECVECYGEWSNEGDHGHQFVAAYIEAILPNSVKGVLKFLSAGVVKGIGPRTATILVSKFGTEIFSILENEPERLLAIPGIGKSRLDLIIRSWKERKGVERIMEFLHEHGVGTARAIKIYRRYGDDAIEKIEENPYRLAHDVYGIGFETADNIALKMGMAPNDIKRAQAGIRQVLIQDQSEGNCAIQRSDLVYKTLDLLKLDSCHADLIEDAIEEEALYGTSTNDTAYGRSIIKDTKDGIEIIYTTKMHHAETGIALSLARLMRGEIPWNTTAAIAAIPEAEAAFIAKTGKGFSDSQRKAIELVLSSKTTILTGGPGTGKTTIVNTIRKILREIGMEILLCAPTGKAANRLSESTGCPATTIHRRLEYEPSTGLFRKNENNQFDVNLIVIDEKSMVDIFLCDSLLKAIPDNCAILIVGDVDQIQSVGPGAVLADMIKSGSIPTAILTEIQRQAANSKIITNAHRIKNGLMPEMNDYEERSDFYFIKRESPEDIRKSIVRVITKDIPQKFGLNPLVDIQVLSPSNKLSLGSNSLNIELQKVLNGDSPVKITKYGITYALHDKVMQLINNYEKDVTNGEIGKITNINEEHKTIEVTFDEKKKVAYDLADLDQLALGYCTSIHKSQGSEYQCVIIPLSKQFHRNLLYRNLLFTGVTRGRVLVLVIGSEEALRAAINNTKPTQRITKLAERIAAAVRTHAASEG